MKPSYIALSISGLLLGIILFIFIRDWYNNKELDTPTYQLLMLLSILSIAIGVHGIGHAYAEINFNFDPLKTGSFVY